MATRGSEDVQVPSAVIVRPCDCACQRMARIVAVPPAAPGPPLDSSMYGYVRVCGRTVTGIDAVKPLYAATISAAPEPTPVRTLPEVGRTTVRSEEKNCV